MANQEIPRYELAEQEMEPRVAKRFIADELQLVRMFPLYTIFSFTSKLHKAISHRKLSSK